MRRLVIQNSLKCTETLQIFFNPLPNPIGIFFINWGLTNNNYNLYLLQFMIVSVNIRSCYICIPWLSIYSWTVEQIGKYIFCLLKATQIWLFAFCVVLIQSIVILLKKRGVHVKNFHQIICHTQWWHHKFLL